MTLCLFNWFKQGGIFGKEFFDFWDTLEKHMSMVRIGQDNSSHWDGGNRLRYQRSCNRFYTLQTPRGKLNSDCMWIFHFYLVVTLLRISRISSQNNINKIEKSYKILIANSWHWLTVTRHDWCVCKIFVWKLFGASSCHLSSFSQSILVQVYFLQHV